MHSISSWFFAIASLHASQISPLATPPKTFVQSSPGRLTLWSFSRIRLRKDSSDVMTPPLLADAEGLDQVRSESGEALGLCNDRIMGTSAVAMSRLSRIASAPLGFTSWRTALPPDRG